MASIRMWGPKAHIWSLRVFSTCTCSVPITWMLVSKANGPAPDLLNQIWVWRRREEAVLCVLASLQLILGPAC